tara:strand:- start:2980 stop:3816 length:837 start_codon:yes stop_codon:yes gene_type:complete
MSLRAVVLGAARDCEFTLPATLTAIASQRIHFKSMRFVFFENDSRDATLSILEAFCSQDPTRRSVITTTDLRGSRVQRLAFARQQLLEHVAACDDIAVLADLDEVNSRISGVESALRLLVSGELDVACANQRIWYYDRFALRGTNVPPAECEGESATRCTLRDHRIPSTLFGNRVSFAQNSEYALVDSAFGGLCLVRAEVLRRAQCAYLIDDAAACEHVAFMRCLGASGAKIGIVKSFVNAGWDGAITSAIFMGIIMTGLGLFVVSLCLAHTSTAIRR